MYDMFMLQMIQQLIEGLDDSLRKDIPSKSSPANSKPQVPSSNPYSEPRSRNSVLPLQPPDQQSIVEIQHPHLRTATAMASNSHKYKSKSNYDWPLRMKSTSRNP